MNGNAGAEALSSRTVALRPLLPSDGEWFYALLCGPAGERWKYRGRTPAPDVVADDMWRGVFAQFVVVQRATGERSGVVGFYNVASDAGRAHAFAIADPRASVAVVEGFGLLCAWGFDHHGFSRVFIETPEFNLLAFESLRSVAVVEGRLRNYDFWRGRYWDLFILSIGAQAFRDRFGKLLESRASALTPSSEMTAEDFRSLVTELWPLDSLGMVEVLDALEVCCGQPVSGELLALLSADDDLEWSAQALQLAGVPTPSAADGARRNIRPE